MNTMEIILTIDAIDEAMRGNTFWRRLDSQAAKIVQEATRRGYLSRLSHTQVQWTEEGLAKARQELVVSINWVYAWKAAAYRLSGTRSGWKQYALARSKIAMLRESGS